MPRVYTGSGAAQGTTAAPTGTPGTDTATIQAALDAAAAAGGGVVQLQAGTYAAQVAVDTGVTLRGAGIGATTIRLPAGATGAVVTTKNFATLTGSNAVASPHHFVVEDLTIDGNKTASGAGGHAVAFYGYAWTLRNVRLQNATGHGLYMEWSSASNPGIGPMEATIQGFRIENNNGVGIWHAGPHDSHFLDGIVYGNGIATGQPGSTVGTGRGAIHVGPTADVANGSVWETIHVWGNQHDYGIWLNGNGNTLTSTVQLESARVAQLYLSSSNRVFAKLFSGNVAPTTVKGVVFATGFPGAIRGDIYVEDCGGAVVDFTGAGGFLDLTIRAKYTATPAPAVPFPNMPTKDSRIRCFVSGSDGLAAYDNGRTSSVTQMPTARVAAGDYLVPIHTSTGTTTGIVAGTFYLAPVDVGPARQTFRGMGTGLSVLGAGGNAPLVRMGLYQDDGTGTAPTGAPITGSEVTFDPTTGAVGDRAVDFAADITLGPRRYWVALQLTHGGTAFTTNPTFISLNGTVWYGSRNDLSNNAWKCWTSSGSSSATALTGLGTLVRSTLLPIIGLRAR